MFLTGARQQKKILVHFLWESDLDYFDNAAILLYNFRNLFILLIAQRLHEQGMRFKRSHPLKNR